MQLVHMTIRWRQPRVRIVDSTAPFRRKLHLHFSCPAIDSVFSLDDCHLPLCHLVLGFKYSDIDNDLGSTHIAMAGIYSEFHHYLTAASTPVHRVGWRAAGAGRVLGAAAFTASLAPEQTPVHQRAHLFFSYCSTHRMFAEPSFPQTGTCSSSPRYGSTALLLLHPLDRTCCLRPIHHLRRRHGVPHPMLDYTCSRMSIRTILSACPTRSRAKSYVRQIRNDCFYGWKPRSSVNASMEASAKGVSSSTMASRHVPSVKARRNARST